MKEIYEAANGATFDAKKQCEDYDKILLLIEEYKTVYKVKDHLFIGMYGAMGIRTYSPTAHAEREKQLNSR